MDQLFPDTPFVVPVPPRPPNYINPETRGPTMNSVGITFTSISLVFVLFRIYTRAAITKRVYAEDWLSILAWLLSVFYVICNWWATKSGVGRHWWDIPYGWFFVTSDFPGTYISGTVYWVAMLLIKMIILLLLHRLTPSVTYRRCVYAAGIFIFTTSVLTGFASTFPCIHPLSASWRVEDRMTKGLKCINYDAVLKTMSLFNLVGDLMCLALPVYIIASSQMATRRKTHVLTVFILGGVASVIAIVRVIVTYETERPENLVDYNWAAAKLMTLATVEINVGIVCSCLPAVKQGLAYWFPTVFGSYSSMHPSAKSGDSAEKTLRQKIGGNTLGTELGLRRNTSPRDLSESTSDITVVGGEESWV